MPPLPQKLSFKCSAIVLIHPTKIGGVSRVGIRINADDTSNIAAFLGFRFGGGGIVLLMAAQRINKLYLIFSTNKGLVTHKENRKSLPYKN